MLQPFSFRARASRRGVLSFPAIALPLAAFALGVALLLPAPVRADPTASDTASNPAYNSGWADGSNGGFGFMPWILGTNGAGSAGRFIGSSNNNGTGGSTGIDTTGGKAFGLFANSGGESTARRNFGNGLVVGDAFNINIDNGNIDTGSSVGFDLLSGSGVSLFRFMFVGGQSNYTYNDATVSGGGAGPTFTANGLRTSFRLDSPTNYTFTATRLDNSVTTSFVGTIAAGQTVSGVKLFNTNAGFNSTNDFFANNLEIVPEPGTLGLALPVLGAAGMGAGLRRRRRARRAA